MSLSGPVLISLTVMCSSAVASGPACSVFLTKGKGAEVAQSLSPMSSLMAQLEGRLAKLNHVVSMGSPQSQRQAQKLGRRLTTLIVGFVETGDISDANLEKLMALNVELDKFERRFLDPEIVKFLSPRDLSRYLYTEEPITPNFEYNADLPGLGEVAVEFSKEVAELFSKVGGFRDSLFPIIFNGMVGKVGQDGLKGFTGEHNTKIVGEVIYTLVELKNIGAGGYRIIAVNSSDGKLVFYKFISNHHRVEYVAKGDFLNSFLRSYLK